MAAVISASRNKETKLVKITLLFLPVCAFSAGQRYWKYERGCTSPGGIFNVRLDTYCDVSEYHESKCYCTWDLCNGEEWWTNEDIPATAVTPNISDTSNSSTPAAPIRPMNPGRPRPGASVIVDMDMMLLFIGFIIAQLL